MHYQTIISIEILFEENINRTILYPNVKFDQLVN